MDSMREPRSYAAAKTAALSSELVFTGIEKARRTEHFHRAIILNRLFANQPESWVLKGASALIWRDTGSRATRDIDLLCVRDDDIATAHRHLQEALDAPTTPPYDISYQVSDPIGRWSAEGPHGRVCTVKVTIVDQHGRRLSQPVKIDMVMGDHMTGEPEIVTSHELASVLRAAPQRIRVYPIHDHLADKIAATFKTYGGNASTRIRDLADIVHISEAHTLSMNALRRALDAVRLSTGSGPYPDEFTAPPGWRELYEVHRMRFGPSAPCSFDEAMARAQALINPVLAEEGGPDLIWRRGRWESGETA